MFPTREGQMLTLLQELPLCFNCWFCLLCAWSPSSWLSEGMLWASPIERPRRNCRQSIWEQPTMLCNRCHWIQQGNRIDGNQCRQRCSDIAGVCSSSQSRVLSSRPCVLENWVEEMRESWSSQIHKRISKQRISGFQTWWTLRERVKNRLFNWKSGMRSLPKSSS